MRGTREGGGRRREGLMVLVLWVGWWQATAVARHGRQRGAESGGQGAGRGPLSGKIECGHGPVGATGPTLA